MPVFVVNCSSVVGAIDAGGLERRRRVDVERPVREVEDVVDLAAAAAAASAAAAGGEQRRECQQGASGRAAPQELVVE